MATMNKTVPRFQLEADITIQTRRAQVIDAQFAEAIRQVCRENSNIVACYLLDARKPEAEEIVTIIAVTVENEAKNIETVAQQFWEMIQAFPQQVARTFIMSSANFRDGYSGSEFYVKQ